MKKAIPDPKKVDKLYKKYGKPLEGQHWGEFLAVSQDGKIVLGKDLVKVANKALSSFGSGSFLYKVGEVAIYKSVTVRMV